LLRCDFGFSTFAACLKGRLLAVENDEIKLISDDSESELTLRLTPEMEFGYGDSRQSPEDAELYVSGLVIFLGELTDENDPDTISFAEMNPANSE
jgi:hypothetical protein